MAIAITVVACDKASVIKLNPITGLQQQTCASKEECLAGYVCQQRFCVRGCTTKTDCDTGQVCNADHYCISASVAKKLTEACFASYECEAGLVCATSVCTIAPPSGSTGGSGRSTAPVCGNGKLEGNETCDDGDTSGSDYCSADCTMVTGRCGDLTQQSNEVCDDGNTSDTDSCSADCTLVHFCGDGSKQANEACDDGNQLNGDYCASTCQQVLGYCGDANVQNNEACDDGNTTDGDYCPGNCLGAAGSANDGIVQPNEQCDGSVASAGLTMCRSGANESDGYLGSSTGGGNRGTIQCPAGQRMIGFEYSWNRYTGLAFRPIVGFRIFCNGGGTINAPAFGAAPDYFSNLPGFCCGGTDYTYANPSSHNLPTVTIRCPDGTFMVGGRGFDTWYSNVGARTVGGALTARCQGNLSAPLTTTTSVGDTNPNPTEVSSPAIDFICPQGKAIVGMKLRSGDVFDGFGPVCEP
ncbi:MAG: hypothetical protein IT381_17730 [Deltaproteobacteria bacterium]|nr:hypothetical protein [Deltaproteobacteria bacterium]